jgi:hypothetical protein
VSTPINEAYARIDIGAIQKLQRDINAIKDLIYTGDFSVLDIGNKMTKLSVRATAIYAERKNVGSGTNKVTIEFGDLFESIPIISATIRDSSGKLEESDSSPIALITELTRKKAEFFVKKSKTYCEINVIAVGPRKLPKK